MSNSNLNDRNKFMSNSTLLSTFCRFLSNSTGSVKIDKNDRFLCHVLSQCSHYRPHSSIGKWWFGSSRCMDNKHHRENRATEVPHYLPTPFNTSRVTPCIANVASPRATAPHPLQPLLYLTVVLVPPHSSICK